MGLLDRWHMRKVFEMQEKAYLKEISESIGRTQIGSISGLTKTGQTKRTTEAMIMAYHTSPWFRGVTEKVAWAAAIVPWHLFAVKPSDAKSKRTYVKHSAVQTGESFRIRQRILKRLKASERLVQVEDHILLDAMAEPNPVLTGVDVRYLSFAYYLTVGESFWAMGKNEFGGHDSIWPIPPHWIMETPTADDPFFVVRVNGSFDAIHVDDMVWFKNPSLHNPYGRGKGLGLVLADELETDEYIAKFQNTFFLNRGKPDIVFAIKGQQTPGGMVYPSEERLREAKQKFENEFRDVRRGGRSFWAPGDVTIHELSQKIIDLDMIEQRSWIKDLVRQVYGVPPEIMGDVQNSNRATIEEAIAIFSMLSTEPQLERMRAQMQMKLVPRYDARLVIDYESPVPDPREFHLRAMQMQSSAATQGEWRSMMGLSDRGEADNIHLYPMGVIPIEGPTIESPKGLLPQSTKSVKKTIGFEDVEVLLAAVTAEPFDEEVTPEIEETVVRWGDVTTDEITGGGFVAVNPATEAHVAEWAGQHIEDINETTRGALRVSLRNGIASAEGIPELAERISDVFDAASKTRSTLIARTEVARSANFGKFEAYRQSGVVPMKRWVATGDARTRDVHAGLHGTAIPIGEKFQGSDGDSCLYPGEWGRIENNANERCTTAPVVEGEESRSLDELDVIGKQFIDETSNDEDRVRRASDRAFDRQSEDVLRALRGLA